MTPNFNSFLDQCLLIKLSEEKPGLNPLYTRIAKNLAAYSVGAGLGTAGAFAISHKVLPKLLPKLTPKQVSMLAGGAALLSAAPAALASHSAYRTWMQGKQEEEEWKRKRRK